MSLADLRLSIFAFPQRWDGVNLDVNVLLLPVDDPTVPRAAGVPAFAGHDFSLSAVIIPGLDALPRGDEAAALSFSLATSVPADAEALYQALAAQYAPKPPATRTPLDDVRIKKALPPSYTQAFPFSRPRNDVDFTLGNAYGCDLRGKDPKPRQDPPPATISWGQLISYALRQPRLAEEMGLIYRVRIEVDPPVAVRDGAWLYVTPDPADPFLTGWPATPDLIRRYAARLPALDANPAAGRALFAAVLFPVVPVPTNAHGLESVYVEAENYDDGFAKILHSNQPVSTDAAVGDRNDIPPATDAGIQVGWDDEQVTDWLNRQLDNARARANPGAPGSADAIEAPLGVIGYRIDVRQDGGTPWRSLNLASAPLTLGPFTGVFQVEPALEPMPLRSLDPADLTPWLPRYFALWRGKSLVVNDPAQYILTGGENPLPPSFQTPVLPADIRLLYGHRYEFRTRLVDLTGGGPGAGDPAINPAAAPTTECLFLRHVPPKSARIETGPPVPPGPVAAGRSIDQIKVWRPLIGYPELLFAGVDEAVVPQLIANVPTAKANHEVLGVNDPGVVALRIVVEARAPAFDIGPPGEAAGDLDGPFRVIYQVDRAFPSLPADPLARGPALVLDLEYQDIKNISDLSASPPAEGEPLTIPRARDVRIRLIPIGDDRANYFASDDARFGLTTDLMTRKDAINESDLFAADTDANRLKALWLQPGSDLFQRLAQALDLELDISGAVLSGKPGRRTVFGASKMLRHTLAGDHGSITFSGPGELLNHWVVAIRLDLDRDWTWDGLDDAGIQVDRDGQTVGTIEVRQTLAHAAISTDTPPLPEERARTRLVFFDAVDPNWKSPGSTSPFPTTPAPRWTLTPKLVGSVPTPAPVVSLGVTLPVAIPPRQTPTIASAGIALEPYAPAPDYSSTAPRRRVLWIELESPPEDDNDGLFARVLAYGPDPLLAPDTLGQVASGYTDPALTIDPEPIRVITPGQPSDTAGLDAMLPMTASTDKLHYVVPLPPGLDPDDLTMFGFWTYELRFGHARIWSTAQARFGRPLKVTGIQHPAPVLLCKVVRTKDRVEVSAPFATPILRGGTPADLRRSGPSTQLWFLLYARVLQADRASYRNVLLGSLPADELHRQGDFFVSDTRDFIGEAMIEKGRLDKILEMIALPADTPLGVLAVELLPGGSTPISNPLDRQLGAQRILRTSPLTAVPAFC